MGRPVFLLEGERTNIKITVPEDIILAEALLRSGRVP
jgi:2-C-methyl-D-erythritol 4-phosphate cytidylyltransferase